MAFDENVISQYGEKKDIVIKPQSLTRNEILEAR